MVFILCAFSPFKVIHVGVESVELELEVVGSIGGKCNVIRVFRVGNLGCLQGCDCPMVQGIQELAQVICKERE